MSIVRVAACQMTPRIGEVEANLEDMERWVERAAQAGAALAVLPEAAVTGYAFASLEEALTVARRATAVAAERLSAMAARHSMALVAGTLEAEGEQVYNTALVAAPDGERFRYRKIHLPFLGVDRFATAGTEPPAVYELAGLRVGVLICYDLRFPEAARVCALEGADLIALPTNWPVSVEFHPGLFAPARAAENHCYLLAADRVGSEGGTTFIGRSLLVDCDGQLIASAGADEALVVGDVDRELARQTHVTRRPGEHEWDTIADRRPGLYQRLLEPAIDRLHPPSASVYSPDAD